MHADVKELRDFYTSPLGRTCAEILSGELRSLWPDVSNRTVIGIGYATPFLAPFEGEALRLGALMPAIQGVICWPHRPPFKSALIDSTQLPLPDLSVDFILVAHGIEMTGDTRGLLREVWRVLKPDGKLVLFAANRLSPWASIDSTPFGHGRPYSRGQLSQLLQNAMFEPVEWRHALFFPPYRRVLSLQRYLGHWEKLGRRFWPGVSGVFIVEASKQVYAAQPKNGLRARAPRLGPILLPEAPKPARLGNAGISAKRGCAARMDESQNAGGKSTAITTSIFTREQKNRLFAE